MSINSEEFVVLKLFTAVNFYNDKTPTFLLIIQSYCEN